MEGKKEPMHFGLGERAVREGRKEERQQSWKDRNSGRRGRGEREREGKRVTENPVLLGGQKW